MLCDKGIYFSNENNPLASCKKKNNNPLPWGISTQQMNVSFKCHHSSVTH